MADCRERCADRFNAVLDSSVIAILPLKQAYFLGSLSPVFAPPTSLLSVLLPDGPATTVRGAKDYPKCFRDVPETALYSASIASPRVIRGIIPDELVGRPAYFGE